MFLTHFWVGMRGGLWVLCAEVQKSQNASPVLKVLPPPRGGGAVLFVQHHLLDSVVGSRLGRLGVFQLVFVHRTPTLSSSLEQCGRNTECTDYNTSIRRISTSSKSPGCYGGFEKSRGVFHSTPRFLLAITCPCCYCCFQPPSFNPCRIS